MERNGHPRFYELLAQMREIHDAKNADYAGAREPLANFRLCEDMGIPAWLGALVRLSDKYSRIVELARRRHQNGDGPSVTDERITDTLLDMANYALLTVILLEEEEGHTGEAENDSTSADSFIPELWRWRDDKRFPAGTRVRRFVDGVEGVVYDPHTGEFGDGESCSFPPWSYHVLFPEGDLYMTHTELEVVNS